MALTKLNSLAIPASTIVTDDLTYPLTNFTSTGIDDNATSTAITIDTSENVIVTGDISAQGGELDLTDAASPAFPASIVNTGTLGNNGGYTPLKSVGQLQYSAASHLFAGSSVVSSGYPVAWSKIDSAFTWGSYSNTLMTLDSSGRLGIGGTPTSPLHVFGDVKLEEASPTVTLTDTTDGSVHLLQSINTALNVQGQSQVRITTASTERMRIDSTGRLGLGTTAPAGKQHTALATSHAWGAAWSAGTAVFGGAGSLNGAFGISYNDTNGAVLGAIAPGVAWKPVALYGSEFIFGISGTENARIDAYGNLLVGKTSAGYTTAGIELNGATDQFIIKSNSTPMTINRNTAGPNATVTAFYLENTLAGIIAVTKGSAPVFAASSDERLKDNIVDHESELANVMALRPTRWDWKDGAMGSGEGFIAQELEATAWSDLVSEGDDGFKQVSGLGTVETRLVKAIQEQQAMIETLQAEVAALKGAN